MLGHGRFHFETPNVIDPGDNAPSRPTRPEKDFDKDQLPPRRSSSSSYSHRTGSSSSYSHRTGSSSNYSDNENYVYKPPLSRTIKLDYRLSQDDEPTGGAEDDVDDEEYGVPLTTMKSSPNSSNSASYPSPSHEQARLFAATILSESERRESKRNLFDGKNKRMSSVRKIWSGARRSSDDMAPLRKAVGMEKDGVMRAKRSRAQEKTRCCNCILLLLGIVGLVVGFGLAASKAMRQRDANLWSADVSERLKATINALSDGGISSRQDLTRTSSPQYHAARWIADVDAEQMELPDSLESSRFVQRYVLALLYYAWGGNNWINGLHFTSESHECSWFDAAPDENGERFAIGVTCDDDLQVENLLIPSNNLKGTIPKEIRLLERLNFLSLKHNELSGTLPAGIVRLTKLDYVDLKFNQLTGTIPNFLGDLQQLQVLGLSKNSFEGTIPDVLSDLPLKTLAIDDNMLTGDLTNIGSISTLEYLYVEDNDFDGSLDQGILSGLTNLIEADLSGNRLEAGFIPSDIFALPQLRVLDLSANSIVGSLPESIPDNSVLEYLNLRLNSISSSIPDSISNLHSLTHLDLESNSLTGVIPENRIAELEKLTYLFLGKNPLQGGTIPESFQSLVALRELSLDDIRLNGAIPAWLDKLTGLKLLDLRHNELTGSLDGIDFSKLSELAYLLLSDNKLTGPIPAALSGLDDLAVIALHHNGFIGVADDLCSADSGVDLLTTDCGEVECECCDDCCDGDNCYEGLIWDSLENTQGTWEEHFRRADYSFNPHILFDYRHST